MIKSDLFLRIASLGTTNNVNRAIHALEGAYEREYVKGVRCKVNRYTPSRGGVSRGGGVRDDANPNL